MSFFDMSGVLGAIKLFAIGGFFGIVYAFWVKKNLMLEERRQRKIIEDSEKEEEN